MSAAPVLVLGIGACGGERADGDAAAAHAGHVAARDLIGRAAAEAVVGPLTDEPTERELTLTDTSRATSCLYMGETGTVMARVAAVPGESTSAALVARLQAERALANPR